MQAVPTEFRLKPIAQRLRGLLKYHWGWGALAALPGVVLAGPSGENVVAGSAAILRPDAQHTRIDQSSHRAVVDWQQFSIGGDEYVLINQPSATAAILNRVVGASPSSIFGHLTANGRVFIVNPSGVYFGPGSKVDVGSLTASILDIGNDDFMAGNYVFVRPEDAPAGAAVVNEGEIKVGDGGYVVLAGDYVNNTGIIEGRLGTVVLAAGSRMTLDLSDSGLVNFAVDEAVVSELAGVENLGEIVADGGRVLMTAKVARDLAATAVNNEGLIRAHRVVEEGGEVYLRASGGDIEHTGMIDVAAEDGQSGGRVLIKGDGHIALADGSEIRAGGDGSGGGGTVRVIADGRLNFSEQAAITAIGGTDEAGGGFVELSGHAGIAVRGAMELGAGGQAVLDPAVLTINAGSGGPTPSYGTSIGVGRGFIEGALNTGIDLTLVASNTINASGGPFAISATGSGDLALKLGVLGDTGGSGSFHFPGSSYGFFNCFGDGICGNIGSGGVIPSAIGNINLAGVDINVGGAFTASAGRSTGDVTLGNVAAGGNVVIKAGNLGAGGNITVGNVTAASSMLDLEAFGGNVTAGALTLTGSGEQDATIDVDANTTTGTVMIAGRVLATAGSDVDISIDGKNVTINGGAGMPAVTATAGNGCCDRADIDIGQINVTNTVTITGNVLATAGSDASVSIDGHTVSVMGGITANGGSSAFIDVEGNFTTGAVTITGPVLGTANGGELSISISAGVSVTVGAVTAMQLGTNSYADIDIDARAPNGTVLINGPVTATAIGSDASISISGGSVNGSVTINGAVTATASDAEIWIDAANINVNAPVTANGSSWSAEIDIAGGRPGVVNINAPIRAIATGGADASIEISGGMVTVGPNAPITASAVNGNAYIDINASWSFGTLTVNAPVTVTAGSYGWVEFSGNAINANSNVTVTEAGGGYAEIYFYWHDGAANINGQQLATAGPGGWASIGLEGSGPLTVQQLVRANGAAGDEVWAFANNALRTTGAGQFDADEVWLGISGAGIPVINAKTKSPDIYIGNFGAPPDVTLDNRAYTGLSEVQFGGSGGGGVLRAASFLFNGPAVFRGGLSAANLTVGVTNGPVGFDGAVNIGSLPLPLTPDDNFLFTQMTADGLAPPLHGANLAIAARDGIGFNGPLRLFDPYPYVKLATNGPIIFDTISVPGPQALAVYSPINFAAPVEFERDPFPPPLGGVGYNAMEHVFAWPDAPGTTVVIGAGLPQRGPVLTGPVGIGGNGGIDLGVRNMYIISRGPAVGEDLVATEGVFELIGVMGPPEPIVPVDISDIVTKESLVEEEEEEEEEGGEDGGGGDDGGSEETEITEDSSGNEEQMECG